MNPDIVSWALQALLAAGGFAGIGSALRIRAENRRLNADALQAGTQAARTLNDMALSMVGHWEERALAAEKRIRELETEVAELRNQLHAIGRTLKHTREDT